MNNDLENYLKDGTLPMCRCCHKKRGVKAKSEYMGRGMEFFLYWLCEDCMDSGEYLSTKSKCPNCKKELGDHFYLYDEQLFCSRECAYKYEGFHTIEEWNKIRERDDQKDIILHIS